MYRVMKSERVTLDHAISGQLSSYRQIEIGNYLQFPAALGACRASNTKERARFYVLNASGQEYYDGSWID